METNYFSTGTISHGTMRPQDLIPVFLGELATVDGPRAREMSKEVPVDAWDADDHDYWDSEEAGYLLNEDIWEVMQEYCPEYCYFGSTEGDGADYGCWVDWYVVEDAVHDGELIKVGDLADVPEGWAGMVLVVNDHGNATLYRPRVEYDAVWGVV